MPCLNQADGDLLLVIQQTVVTSELESYLGHYSHATFWKKIVRSLFGWNLMLLCHLSGVIHTAIISIKMHYLFSISMPEECFESKIKQHALCLWLVIANNLLYSSVTKPTYHRRKWWLMRPVSLSSYMQEVYICM